MSDCQVPVYVDTRRVFQQDAEVAGFVALERLPQFRNSLVSDRAEIHVQLRFSLGDTGLREIHGHVRATVDVACQRCLEPMTVQLQDEVNLALVADDEQASKLRPDLDPWVCPEIKLQLAELVEEQLLLSMPIVNYHAEQECTAEAVPRGADDVPDELPEASARDNPFAVLEKLKKSD